MRTDKDVSCLSPLCTVKFGRSLPDLNTGLVNCEIQELGTHRE